MTAPVGAGPAQALKAAIADAQQKLAGSGS
jgi:hypothetical protein